MIHRPPHIYLDQEWYFITAHTNGRTPFFISNEQKSIWVNELKLLSNKFRVDIVAWVLLNDHYHLLRYFDKSTQILNFLKSLHGVTSYRLINLIMKEEEKFGTVTGIAV